MPRRPAILPPKLMDILLALTLRRAHRPRHLLRKLLRPRHSQHLSRRLDRDPLIVRMREEVRVDGERDGWVSGLERHGTPALHVHQDHGQALDAAAWHGVGRDVVERVREVEADFEGGDVVFGGEALDIGGQGGKFGGRERGIVLGPEEAELAADGAHGGGKRVERPVFALDFEVERVAEVGEAVGGVLGLADPRYEGDKVVAVVLANGWEIRNGGDAEFRELCRSTNAGVQEDTWRVDYACGENDLFVADEFATVDGLNPRCMLARKCHFRNLSSGDSGKVRGCVNQQIC